MWRSLENSWEGRQTIINDEIFGLHWYETSARVWGEGLSAFSGLISALATTQSPVIVTPLLHMQRYICFPTCSPVAVAPAMGKVLDTWESVQQLRVFGRTCGKRPPSVSSGQISSVQ